MKTHFLYRHIRLDKNIPFYIGIGTCNEINGKLYYSRSCDKSNRNYIWHKIVNKTKYRVDIILESNDYEFIKLKEKEFIKLYGRINLKTGSLANMTDGGDGNLNPSLQCIEKRKINQRGKIRSEEYKKNLSESRKGAGNPMFGKKVSDENKLKTSLRFKGKKLLSVRRHTQETKEKLSKDRLGAKHWKSKTILDISNGIFYETTTEAALILSINRGYLSNMLLGKNKNKTNMIYV